MLSADQLGKCAQQVRTLRERAPALNQRSRQLDKRRRELAARRERLDQNDDPGQQAWGRYNTRAATFNDDMAQFRSDVTAINEIKRAYDRNCANHSYRDSDFRALSRAAREAMTKGLSNVRVPYTEDGSQPQR